MSARFSRPQSASRSSSSGRLTPRPISARLTFRSSSTTNRHGVRRKRVVNPRIRHIYQGTGRDQEVSAKLRMAQRVAKSRKDDFAEPEMLLETINHLKKQYKDEQERCIKAQSRVRRLEEALGGKEKRIEELLRSRASIPGPETERQVAARERHQNYMVLKLQAHIAQQNELVERYETTINDLRSSLKRTHLMEVETERDEYYEEVLRLKECLRRHDAKAKQKLRHYEECIDSEAVKTAEIERLKLTIARFQDKEVEWTCEKEKLKAQLVESPTKKGPRSPKKKKMRAPESEANDFSEPSRPQRPKSAGRKRAGRPPRPESATPHRKPPTEDHPAEDSLRIQEHREKVQEDREAARQKAIEAREKEQMVESVRSLSSMLADDVLDGVLTASYNEQMSDYGDPYDEFEFDQDEDPLEDTSDLLNYE